VHVAALVPRAIGLTVTVVAVAVVTSQPQKPGNRGAPGHRQRPSGGRVDSGATQRRLLRVRWWS